MSVDRYVDRDVVGGLGDGTSWANAYATLDAWQSAEATDLVTSEEQHTVYYRAASDNPRTSSFNFSGWTTNADYHVELIVPLTHRHNGSLDSGTRIVSSNWSMVIPAYTRIIGLSVQSTAEAPSLLAPNAAGIQIIDCLLFCSAGRAIRSVDEGTWVLQNSIAISGSLHAIETANSSSGVILNSVVRGGTGDAVRRSGGSLSVVSTYAYGAGNGFGQFGISATNCFSPDATHHGSVMSLEDAGFVNVATDEEHLILTSESQLRDAGQDNSAHASWFGAAVDFRGTSRPQGEAWDIGAYEYVDDTALPMPQYIYGA